MAVSTSALRRPALHAPQGVDRPALGLSVCCVGAAVLGGLSGADVAHPGAPGCLLRAVTGIPCPFCGLTHSMMALGQGLKHLIDRGFANGDRGLLEISVLVLFGVAVLLALGTYARFYLVTWVGERVVTDIRRAIFNHLLSLDPGFFEATRTGEVLSRITTDTTLLQAVVGSSISVALRNLLMFVGGMGLLLLTSPKLTGLVLLVVPLVMVPILFFGRKVRGLSRSSQDKVAEVSAEASEALYAIATVQIIVLAAIYPTPEYEAEQQQRVAHCTPRRLMWATW